MASIIPLPGGARVEHRGLSHWMDRVLTELEALRKSPAADTVHDLRVALRRCRSLAAAMEEVDPHPAWEEMRKLGRRLFRSLGSLRDAQVQQQWIRQLAPPGDAFGTALSAALHDREAQFREKALRKAARFDEKRWSRLARILERRARLVPLASPAAECLALERLEDVRELHRLALRTERPKPWHKLRVGVKRFRYTVEAFLPERYAVWSDDLKRLQDLLGDVHDLDVLRELVRRHAASSHAAEAAAWEQKISADRAARIESYRQFTLGSTSLLNRWRLGLPANGKLEAAAFARLRVTAAACDPHRRKTAQTARFAKAILEAGRRAHCAPVFRDTCVHRAFSAIAILHGIRPAGYSRVQQKAAARFLATRPAPAGWSPEQWPLVVLAIRYSRGKEPKNTGGKFGRLTSDEQNLIAVLAGVFRIGRALRKIGLDKTSGIRAQVAPDEITICIPGLPDTPEVASTLSAAKHLLERGLGKWLHFRNAEPARKKLVVIPESSPNSGPLAAASD